MRKTPAAVVTATFIISLALVFCAAFPGSAAATRLSDAASRAVQLQKSIDSNSEVLNALDERIKAMELRLFRKKTEMADAKRKARSADHRFREHVVSMYKSGELETVEIIVDAVSLRDFYYRANMISQLTDDRRRELVDARLTRNEAEYAAGVVAQMRVELQQMKRERKKQRAKLQADLATQRAIIRTLTRPARAEVSRVQRRSATTRQQWQRSSLPVGTVPGLSKASVHPYTQTYLVTSHQPKRYRSAGGKYTAVCSWYGNEFHGRRTASGQIFNQNDFTCASRSLPFGTRLALTRGSRRIVVVVTDRGPFVHGRDLDLSRGAARALGIGGVGSVSAERVTVVR